MFISAGWIIAGLFVCGCASLVYALANGVSDEVGYRVSRRVRSTERHSGPVLSPARNFLVRRFWVHSENDWPKKLIRPHPMDETERFFALFLLGIFSAVWWLIATVILVIFGMAYAAVALAWLALR